MILVSRCTSIVNHRWGFWDETAGNTYLMCHGELNYGDSGAPAGGDYKTVGTNQTSFFGCYTEANPNLNQVMAPAQVFGGLLGDEAALVLTSGAFTIGSGISHNAPVAYENPRGSTRIRFSIGANNATDMDAFEWSTGDFYDYTVMRYLDAEGSDGDAWWSLQNSSYYRQVMRFPTSQTNARQPAPWCTNGLFIGRDDYPVGSNPVAMHFMAAPSPPATSYSGTTSPQTYERGDVVWNSSPTPGGPLGQVCTAHGTQSTLRPIATTGDLPALSTALTLADATYFAVNQYVTIAGVTGIRRIAALAGAAATLDSAGDNVAAIVDGAVAVKMIGTIATGTPYLDVDDSSRLTIGQYLTIEGVTEPKQIRALGTPAALECATAGPYVFVDGDTLVVKIDGGQPQTVTFLATVVTAIDVATLLDATLKRSTTAPTAGDTTVTITSDTKGVNSHVQVTGGTANAALGFSTAVVYGTADPTVTLTSNNTDATASDAIIEFLPATFGQFGWVEHLGTTIDPPDSYLASAGETVVVTTAARTVLLPASPNDADEVAVLNMCGGTTTVDPNGGSIYTLGGSDTLADDGTTTYRYVGGVVSLWKRAA